VKRLLASILVALALAPGAAAAVPNPCTLLTNADVAKVFGAKIASRVGDGNRLHRGCTWNGIPAGSFTSYHATLRIDVAQISRAQFDTIAKKTKHAVPIRGLGEAAFSSYMAGEFLAVWHSGIYLAVELTGGSSPVAAAKMLAREALTRF
jgi:hypothetical protein